MLADYWRGVKQVSQLRMSYLIMYWNWQISINDYMSKKCVSMSQCRLAYLFFLVFRTTWTWLTETCTSVVNGNPSHCCGCLPGHVVAPAVHSATRWAPKSRCLPNAFLRVLVEALLTLWRRRPGKLGTNRQAGGVAIQVRVSLAGMIGRKMGDQLLQNRCVCSR